MTAVVCAYRGGSAAAILVDLVESASSSSAATPEPAEPSVWTVDLLLLLHARGVSASLHSLQVLGATAAHASLGRFYTDVLALDGPRVAAQFEAARALGLSVREEGVPLAAICERLARRDALCIVLVDLRALACLRCCGAKAVPAAAASSFSGHYIVLTDFCTASETFSYMDPAKDEERCTMRAADLDAARKATGTDEDVIIVDRKGLE